MKLKNLATATGVYLFSLFSTSFSQTPPAVFKSDSKKFSSTATSDAVKSAEAWLRLVDESKYSQSWKTAASFFKTHVSSDVWEKQVASVRTTLGKLLSRKQRSSKQVTSLPGVPDGNYVVIEYDSSFEGKKSAIETVTPMQEKDGSWKVSGYFVR